METPRPSGSETSEPMETDSVPANTNQNRSRNVARRGRNRQHTSNDNRTPFERGLTFNGFARNLEPAAIMGHSVEGNDTILYQVRWQNSDDNRTRPIESSLMRSYRPLMIVDFYEEMMKNNLE